MAPSPENDNAPKAPDKNDKSKCEKQTVSEICKEKDKDTKTLSNLNEKDLKALLDEAMSYKIPKDREGKSVLFNSLLNEAEESERNARAGSAGGSELVRHCNPSAKRSNRHRRKPSSISENMMHGGSLDNLAKDELYDADRHLHRTKKSVSARQREGGSLPCNVNSSSLLAYDIHFLEDARTRTTPLKPLTLDTETVNLLEHDSVAENFQEQNQTASELANTAKYTSKATLQINVDDNQIQHMQDFECDKKSFDSDSLQSKMLHSKHNVYITIPNNRSLVEDKKVDENGNHQNPINKGKKKKVSNSKKVTEFKASEVAGNRGEDDIPLLLQFIGGSSAETGSSSGGKNKSNIQKSKLYKQDTEDGKSKKQRSHSKNKESRGELKKSNSMGEISSSKLDDFEFNANQDNEKVILRMNKSHSGDKPRERRSWGNVEPPPFQSLYSNASAENLETLENWVVTKPKKKSKKRRNSISSSRPQNTATESNVKHINNRAPSPDIRGKSTCSVPHSEKSNDSSDVDSVHSLPIDGLNNIPISYADIAKNREKLKEKKLTTPDKCNSSDKVPNRDNRSPQGKQTVIVEMASTIETTIKGDYKAKHQQQQQQQQPQQQQSLQISQQLMNTSEKHVNSNNNVMNLPSVVCNNGSNNNNNVNNAVKSLPPPDVHNIKSFPAISANNNSKVYSSNNNITVCVQSNMSKTFNANNNKNNTVSNKVKSNNPNNKSVKNNLQKINICTIPHNVTTNDIQTDLSIIQANERDSIQFNAQMLPPNIPDVQTIEKMQFLSQQQQQQLQNLSNSQVCASGTTTAQGNLPALNNYQNVNVVGSPIATTPPITTGVHLQKQLSVTKLSTGGGNTTSNNNTNSANCDTSVRTTTTTNDLDERPPPVVILSGMGKNKEVSGLVFGFDINEQLLSEDICQDFIARFMAPEVYTHSSHNHDKIVNFIGSTWESAINPLNGKVEYYTEEL